MLKKMVVGQHDSNPDLMNYMVGRRGKSRVDFPQNADICSELHFMYCFCSFIFCFFCNLLGGEGGVWEMLG